MRKTSHDGGDSTSITSGFENEIRKSSVGIIKTKRNSIKRKVQNFSHESDETVIEPLLQIDKAETINRSAKYSLSKSKTDSLNGRESNSYNDNKLEKYSVSKPICSTEIMSNSNITIHNHMNSNVFGGHDGSKVLSTFKTPVLVEINGSRAAGSSNQTSSIFTTAKIHADSITKTISPVQMTPLPILSTVDGSIVRAAQASDYRQNRIGEPSTSNNNANSSKCYSRLEDGKSDPRVENTVKHTSTLLESKPLDTTTKCESKFSNKSYDSQKSTVTSVTKINDSGMGNKVTQQSHSAINTTSERTGKSSHGQRNDLGTIDNVVHRDSESKIEIVDVMKKENKTFSISSGVNKQLQRQKNTVAEDPKDVDVRLKNVSEVDKNSASKHSLLKDELIINAGAGNKQPSSLMTIKQSKDIDKIQPKPFKQDSVTANVTTTTSNPMTTSVVNKKSLDSNISTKVSSNSSVQPIQTGSHLLKSDFMKAKMFPESQTIVKSVIDNSSIPAGSAKETIMKSTASLQPLQSTTSSKPDFVKNLKGSSSAISKPVTDNTSVSAGINKKTISKSAVTVQPIQATVTYKSDSFDDVKPSGSKGNTSVTPTISKDISVKSTAVVQQPLLPTKLKSDSVKGKKIETENSTKQVESISTTIAPVKPTVTTNATESMKDNTTRRSEISHIPKTSTTIAQQCTTSCDNRSLKGTIDSQAHVLVKSYPPKSPLSVKTITTDSTPPTNTISITKSETVPKPLVTVPTCTNSVVVTSKSESSNKISLPASSKPSTNSTTSALPKPSTSMCQSTSAKSKPKSVDKNEKM